MWYHMQIRQKFCETFNNTKKAKSLNIIFVAKPFLKTSRFLRFIRKKAKFPTLPVSNVN